MRRLAVIAAAVAALSQGACGESRPAPELPVVTIWSSLPLHGPQGRQARILQRSIRGAIGDMRSRLRGVTLRYISLDSSDGQRGWDPGIAAANARRASLDPTTIAYLGELDSGATAVALPILNQAGILQITPTATAEGLTVGGVGAGPGAPYQYYPSGTRTLVRLVPRDAMQGALLASLAKNQRCGSLAVGDDASIYGAGLGQIVVDQARARGLAIAFSGTLAPSASTYAATVRGVRTNCFIYAGEPGSAATRVVSDVARLNPRARILAPDALVSPAFADPRHGGIAPGLARRTTLVGTFAGEQSYPDFGRWLWRNLLLRGGSIVGEGVISAYAAAELAITCQGKAGVTAGRPRRAALIACALGHVHISRALGTYRVLPRGDTNLSAYSRLRIRSGRIERVGPLRVPRSLPSVAVGGAG